MGPRQDAGEDPANVILISLLPLCFNGAPAGCRGRLARNDGKIILTTTELQWGPGRMPGKTMCLLGRELERIHASMGPRQDAGED